MSISKDSAVHRVGELLADCGSDAAVMHPTALFNEGWMLRLILDWFAQQPTISHPLTFSEGSRWFSEALLPSQFLARHRGDELAESWTHADGAIGHFTIGAQGRGDLSLLPEAKQLVILEAKMFSGLSSGTRWAKDFDQAARNIACIAEILCRTKPKCHPNELTSIGFYVLAPKEQIDLNLFAPLLDRNALRAKVEARVAAYSATKTEWLQEWFLPALAVTHIDALSWEETISFIGMHDPIAGARLNEFLQSCIQYNRPRNRSPVP